MEDPGDPQDPEDPPSPTAGSEHFYDGEGGMPAPVMGQAGVWINVYLGFMWIHFKYI